MSPKDQAIAQAISQAARQLVKALDDTLGSSWRDDTLGQDEDGDEVNAAWDELIQAIEGGDGSST